MQSLHAQQSNADANSLPTTATGNRHLPQPRGPNSVGFVDVMTKEDVFVRVLYPTVEQCLDEHERWPIWGDDDKYLTGMLLFSQAMLARWPSWAPRTDFPLIDYMGILAAVPPIGFPTLFRVMNGKVYVPIIENARPDTSKKWPLIVFSHGLGCARSTYSRICYDLASYGFIVCAVEHRDGSACASCRYCEGGQVEWMDHKRVKAEDNEEEFRWSQVQHRQREASKALDLLLDLAEKGKVPKNSLPHSHVSSLVMELLAKCIDPIKPMMAGHSFGGATTVLTLAKDPRFHAGIALDAWLFPLKSFDVRKEVRKSLFFISSDSFRSEDNLNKMKELLIEESEASSSDCERRFVYIKGSVHQNLLDLPFVFHVSLPLNCNN